MIEMFGHKGHFCTTVQDIQRAIKSSLQVDINRTLRAVIITAIGSNKKCFLQVKDAPSIINIMINPQASRKEQKFSWLTESKL